MTLTRLAAKLRTLDSSLDNMISEASDIVQSCYGSGSDIRTEKGTDKALIVEGERLGFLEFGTGAYADPGSGDMAKRVPFAVGSGTWSATHERTWQNMVEKGGMPPEDYPYNREATHGFQTAVDYVEVNLERLLREA